MAITYLQRQHFDLSISGVYLSNNMRLSLKFILQIACVTLSNNCFDFVRWRVDNVPIKIFSWMCFYVLKNGVFSAIQNQQFIYDEG